MTASHTTPHTFAGLEWREAWAVYVAAAGHGGATAVEALAAGEVPTSLADVARVAAVADAAALARHEATAIDGLWSPSPLPCATRTAQGVIFKSSLATTVEIHPDPDHAGRWAVTVTVAPRGDCATRAVAHGRVGAARARLRALGGRL